MLYLELKGKKELWQIDLTSAKVEPYTEGSTYTFTIGKSIFGSGNAAKISGDGYINVSNYGTADNLKKNVYGIKKEYFIAVH